jgi:hypothetical protein
MQSEGLLDLPQHGKLCRPKGDGGGVSGGLKHFGVRRLGRTGLSTRPPLADPASRTDNVWDVDCFSFFPSEVDGAAIHGAYFGWHA